MNNLEILLTASPLGMLFTGAASDMSVGRDYEWLALRRPKQTAKKIKPFGLGMTGMSFVSAGLSFPANEAVI